MFSSFLRRYAPWIGALTLALQPVVARALNLGTPPTGTDLPTGELTTLIGPLINVGLTVLGTVAFLFILYAGYLWMTAMGESEKVEKAQSIMVQATIGLIIIALSWSISNYVISALTTALGKGPQAVQNTK